MPERAPARLRLSGREYLAHMGKLRGMGNRMAQGRGSEILERLGLEPGPDATLDSLSKGNRQKVLLAQAFLAPVDAIVLDEPFGGLDARATAVLKDLLVEVQDAGSSLVMSEHRPDIVTSGSRVLSIADGHVRPARDASLVPRPRKIAEVTLTAPAGRGPSGSWPETLGSRPEVMEVAKVDGRTTVVLVRADGVDGLLRAVLDAGWSVVSVVPRRDP